MEKRCIGCVEKGWNTSMESDGEITMESEGMEFRIIHRRSSVVVL